MVTTAVAVLRKIWRQMCRQIFRETRTLTLPVPARPRGQVSGAVPGVLELPPELQPLIRQILLRLSKYDNFGRGAAAIQSLRALVGELPASANHHHSEPNGLLRHSLEVGLKMVEEVDRRLAAQAELDPSADVSEVSPDAPQWQYLCFLAGVGHDLGKLFDMDLQAGDQRWSPLHETHAEFLRHVKVEPVLWWDEGRVRGGHAQMSPWLMHHLLTPADVRFIGVERLPQLAAAVTGTHAGDQSTPLARLVSRLDQESVEQAAPEWLNKRPDSKVNQFIRALRALISEGGLSVNTPGAPVYVTGEDAAIVVPRSITAARHYLKQEKITLPSNHCLYDLLAQAEVVQADGDRQCVKRIRVPGKHGPVELSTVIFKQETIIPQQVLPTLPKVTFEVVPEEPKPVVGSQRIARSQRRQQNRSADHAKTNPQSAIIRATNGIGPFCLRRASARRRPIAPPLFARHKMSGRAARPISRGDDHAMVTSKGRPTVILRLLICVPLLAAQFVWSQVSALRISGVEEPPELTGEPRKVKSLTETQRQFGEIITSLNEKDQEKVRATLQALSTLIERHPDCSDAYFVRATLNLCTLNSRDYPAIEKDIDTAIAKHMGQAAESMYDKLSDHYALRGRVEFLSGRYRDALSDMELAIRANFLSSDKIFNVEGVSPEQKASKPCTWSLSDFATLTAAMPGDFRPVLLRGLYWIFFTTFGKEDHYAKALQDFQRAAALNPKSPLPPYFIGRVYTKMSFWTKAAWASDKQRDDISRKAIPAYTAAIQLDSKFLPAYEERASAYLGRKQYTQAIRDYDRILELDPDNTTAYADRGLAKLDSGISPMGATFDLGEAIRRKPDDDSNSLAMSHEYRADAYTKIGDYRSALAEYSKAIACRLSNDTFLLSLPQIRALYPEYDSVSDEVLIRKLNALFWPQFEYSVFAKQLRENGKWQISLLNDLYEKRGDAYLRASDFRRGVGDFQRIFKGIPDFAETVERWRSLGVGGDGDQYFLDVKSADFRNGERPQVWIKSVSKDKKSLVLAYEADCKTRRLDQQSAVAYDAAEKLVSSSDVATGWQVVVPGTIGEQLYNGLCSVPRPE